MKPLDRALQRLRERAALPHIPRGARVLDVGCADGTLLRRLGNADNVGIDPDAPEGDARMVRGRFPDDLHVDGPFDAITMLAVYEHFPDDVRPHVVDACRRLLRPGGRVVMTVPSPAVDEIVHVLQRLRLAHGMDIGSHHAYDPARTPDEFAGFRVLVHRPFELGLNHLYVFERTS